MVMVKKNLHITIPEITCYNMEILPAVEFHVSLPPFVLHLLSLLLSRIFGSHCTLLLDPEKFI
jgi:hypothetical protein